MSLNVLVLESVGSCMDADGMVYPMNGNDTPDTNSGVDFLDTTDEWMNSLSDDDNDLLHNWLLENNYSVHVDNDWPDEGIGFSVPEEDPDDGSWEGR